MTNKEALDHLLRIKSPKKSLYSRAIETIYYYYWLYFIIKKKSHRLRLIKAKKVFNTLKRPEFKNQPGRLFAYVRCIDPFVFEELLLLSFKERGLKVIHNKRYTGDGGIDGIVVLPSNQRVAIQAKRYQNHIHTHHIRDFEQAIKKHQCVAGYFIHSGKSGKTIYQNLPQNIVLVSGENLHRLLLPEELKAE